MAAAEITPKYWNDVHAISVKGRFTQAAASDWIVLPYPGAKNIKATTYEGTEETTFTYGTIRVNNPAPATAYSATDTQIVFDAGKITRQLPYYVQTTSGEIIMVYTETDATAATGTASCFRGCLGTTASATGLADNDYLYVQNMIVFGTATVGVVDFEFIPLPYEYRARMFE